MEDMRLKFYTPIVTGKPNLQQAVLQKAETSSVAETSGEQTNIETASRCKQDSFAQVLNQQLEANSGVNFSKHAAKRVADHNIELTNESLDRLNEGVRLAQEKNLEDTLILVGNTAFVVNVQNQTVITAMGNQELQGTVFTNINGTVIV